jgi:orotate phosphoribosyltransferase
MSAITLGSYYLDVARSPNRWTVRRAKQRLAGVRFDTMVGTGLSGSLMIPVLARALNKNWAIVRKPGDSTHSPHMIEGTIGARWVFVDDFIDSGATRYRVIRTVTEVVAEQGHHTEHVGSYLYAGDPPYYETAAEQAAKEDAIRTTRGQGWNWEPGAYRCDRGWNDDSGASYGCREPGVRDVNNEWLCGAHLAEMECV